MTKRKGSTERTSKGLVGVGVSRQLRRVAYHEEQRERILVSHVRQWVCTK